jgi:hypothetical protein
MSFNYFDPAKSNSSTEETMGKFVRIFIFIILTIPTVNSSVAHAKSAYQPPFDQLYPDSSLIGDCNVCHSGQWGRNSYGSDWKSWGEDFFGIENLDSDNDGFTNIDEIVAGTYPGDPFSVPTATNNAPIADAGIGQVVSVNSTILLNGSGSGDPDGETLTYYWSLTSTPMGSSATLSDPSSVSPTFYVDLTGTYEVELIVNDGTVDSIPDIVTFTSVNETWANESPTADAGSDQTVIESVTVTLDGSKSTDPESGVISYLWTQTSGPSVTLSDSTAMQPTFVSPPVDIAGTILAFNLTVEDVGSLQTSSTVSVTVNDNGITGFPDNVLTTTTFSGDPIGIIENNGGVFTVLDTIDPSSITVTPDKPEDLILGLIDINVKVASPGETTTVTVYLSTPAPDGYKWYKYSSSNGWIDYSANAVFNDTRDEVTLTLTDGGLGDDDNEANGVIVDPSGLGTSSGSSSTSVTTTAGDWGGSSGCFVATAAYGSLMEPHVKLLRKFRDRVLLAHPAGKTFVRLYYTYSPPLADFIAKSDALRVLVRWSLLPLVGLSWVALRFGPVAMLFMAVSSLLFIGATVAVFFLGIKKRKLRITWIIPQGEQKKVRKADNNLI